MRTDHRPSRSPLLGALIALVALTCALTVVPRGAIAATPDVALTVLDREAPAPFADSIEAGAPCVLPDDAAVRSDDGSASADALAVEPLATGGHAVIPAAAYYDQAFEVLRIVNRERAQAGLRPLRMDADLLKVATYRATETTLVFSHTRPNGSDCFSAADGFWAENIAVGSTSPESVMNGWMNSPGHRKNILTPGFTTIGVGCVVADGTVFWSQAFGYGSNAADCPQPENAVVGAATELTSSPIVDSNSGEVYRLNPVLHPSSDLQLGQEEQENLYFTQVNPGFPYVETLFFGDAWKSPDTDVVTVDGLGGVTGVNPGNVRLTCQLGDFHFEKGVTVHVGVPVYRLYNPYTHEHLFTIDVNERDSDEEGGWNYEGVAWYSPKTSSTPVYRLYNPNNGDHHYTTDRNEYQQLSHGTWIGEGEKFYGADGSGVPVYRLFNPNNSGAGAHHFTTDATERDSLIWRGWRDEKIGWYGTR